MKFATFASVVGSDAGYAHIVPRFALGCSRRQELAGVELGAGRFRLGRVGATRAERGEEDAAEGGRETGGGTEWRRRPPPGPVVVVLECRFQDLSCDCCFVPLGIRQRVYSLAIWLLLLPMLRRGLPCKHLQIPLH